MKKDYIVGIYAPLDLSKKWYVYVREVGGKIIKKNYQGMNKSSLSYRERMEIAMSLKKIIEGEVEKGGIKKKKIGLPSIADVKYTIVEAVELALEAKLKTEGISESTINSYNSFAGQFINGVKALKFDKEDVSDFEAYHMEIILNKIVEMRGKDDVYFNNLLKAFKPLFSILVEKYIIKYNPFDNIKKKVTRDKKERVLLTDEEYDIVFEYFSEALPPFVLFMHLVEMGIRPKEVLLLKCGDIGDEYIKISKHIAKTNKDRIVPILPYIREELDNIDLSNKDYYLFSGKDFKPNKEVIKKHTLDNLWNKSVVGKLGIKSGLYSLKHRFANTLRRKGVKLEDVKKIFGHHSEEITKIYATEDYNISMNEVSDILKNIFK